MRNDGLIFERVKNILGSHDLPRDNLSLVQHEGDHVVLRVQHTKEGAGSQRLLEELAAVEGVRGTPVHVDEESGHSIPRH